MAVQFGSAANYIPDDFEYNNDISYAHTLEPGTYQGSFGNDGVNTDDTDWYKLYLNEYDTISISVSYSSADGSIQLILYDSSGYKELCFSESYSGYESVEFMVENTNYYYIKLYNSEAFYSNLTYTMSINVNPFNGPYASQDWVIANEGDSYSWNYDYYLDDKEGTIEDQDGAITARLENKYVSGPYLKLKFDVNNGPIVKAIPLIPPYLEYKIREINIVVMIDFLDLIAFGIYPVVPLNFHFADSAYNSVFSGFPGTTDITNNGKRVELNAQENGDIIELVIEYSEEGVLQRFYEKLDITSSPTDNIYFYFDMTINETPKENEDPEPFWNIPGYSVVLIGGISGLTLIALAALIAKNKT
jgi:hypothetical protein